MLRVVRPFLGVAAVVALVLVVRPFLLDGDARPAASAGAGALLGLLAVGAAWWAPVALDVDAALKDPGVLLDVHTLRGPRRVDLAHVRRVWARRFPGRHEGDAVTVVGLTGPGAHVWVLVGRGHGKRRKRLAALVHALSETGQVVVTPRAARALRFDDAPSGARRWVLSLRGTLLYLTGFVAVALLLGAYLTAAGYGSGT